MKFYEKKEQKKTIFRLIMIKIKIWVVACTVEP